MNPEAASATLGIANQHNIQEVVNGIRTGSVCRP